METALRLTHGDGSNVSHNRAVSIYVILGYLLAGEVAYCFWR